MRVVAAPRRLVLALGPHWELPCGSGICLPGTILLKVRVEMMFHLSFVQKLQQIEVVFFAQALHQWQGPEVSELIALCLQLVTIEFLLSDTTSFVFCQ